MDIDEAWDEVTDSDEPPSSPQGESDLYRRETLKIPVFNFGNFLPKFAADHLADLFRVGMPPNWAGKVRIRDARTVVQNDGIPLVWVPRSEIILEMISATGRAERIDVLIAGFEQVADDCHKVLADVQHPLIVDQARLAIRAVEAPVAGHFESAQALAVVVTETAVANVLGANYDKVRKRVFFDPGKTTVSELRLRLALAPIGQFYTSWHPDSGTPNRSLSIATFRCTRRIQPTTRWATPPWQRCSLLRSSEHSRSFKRRQTQSKINTEGDLERSSGGTRHAVGVTSALSERSGQAASCAQWHEERVWAYRNLALACDAVRLSAWS